MYAGEFEVDGVMTPMVWHVCTEGYAVLTPLQDYFSDRYWFQGWSTTVYHWNGTPPVTDGQANNSLLITGS